MHNSIQRKRFILFYVFLFLYCVEFSVNSVFCNSTEKNSVIVILQTRKQGE